MTAGWSSASSTSQVRRPLDAGRLHIYMSENHLRLIPTDPYFVPDPTAMNHAHQLFDALMQGSYKTTMELFDTVQFVVPGSNWDAILCPNCQSVLNIEWWQQAMD